MQIRPLWSFFADEQLGLGKRDFFLQNKPALAFISGLILNFFHSYYLS
jgi:hypothetical protein